MALRTAGQSQQNEIRASIKAVEGQFAKDLITFLGDLGYVLCHLRQIVISFAGYHDTVRLSLNIKADLIEIAYFKR